MLIIGHVTHSILHRNGVVEAVRYRVIERRNSIEGGAVLVDD